MTLTDRLLATPRTPQSARRRVYLAWRIVDTTREETAREWGAICAAPPDVPAPDREAFLRWLRRRIEAEPKRRLT